MKRLLRGNSVKSVKFYQPVQWNRSPHKGVCVKLKVSEIDIDARNDSIHQISKLFHVFSSGCGMV
jgi:hypothetical protein